jgi:outer membrane protein TolC
VASATIRQNLRYAFIQLLSAQESAAIEKDIVRIRKRNLELVKMRYRSGLEHRGSLLTAEANLAQAEYEVAQAQRSIVLARRSLAKNMGLESVREFRADGALVVTAAYDRKPDLDQLVDSTPQLKYIIQQRMAAEYALKASKLDYSPRSTAWGASAGPETNGRRRAMNTLSACRCRSISFRGEELV